MTKHVFFLLFIDKIPISRDYNMPSLIHVAIDQLKILPTLAEG